MNTWAFETAGRFLFKEDGISRRTQQLRQGPFYEQYRRITRIVFTISFKIERLCHGWIVSSKIGSLS